MAMKAKKEEHNDYGTTTIPLGSREAFVLLIIAILLCNHVTAARPSVKSPERYKVLRLHASTENEVNAIKQLQDIYHLDPWRQIRHANTSGDYLVAPHHIHDVQQQLEGSKIPHKVLIDDAESFLHANDPLRHRSRVRRATSAHDFRHRFLTYPELCQFLHHVKETATHARVELGSMGRTFEGRPTPYVKITSLNNSTPKATIFIDGGIHSREWISPAMAVEIIHRLAFNSENDSSASALLNMFNWLIVPLVNPDGYVFTFGPGLENRMWRKNRAVSYSNNPYCYGVDINRNFGFQWSNNPNFGGSTNPCVGTFSGPHSFSEPESRNLRDLLLAHKDEIQGYLSFHSFGQFFLYPWGYSSDVDIEDEEDLLHVAAAFADTMKAKNYHYNVGGAAKTLYPAAGASDDYVRGTVGVKYAYVVELPPHESSDYGFLLPETSVPSVVTDTWAGLTAFAHRLYQHSQSSSTGNPLERPNGASNGAGSISRFAGINNSNGPHAINNINNNNYNNNNNIYSSSSSNNNHANITSHTSDYGSRVRSLPPRIT